MTLQLHNLRLHDIDPTVGYRITVELRLIIASFFSKRSHSILLVFDRLRLIISKKENAEAALI